MKPDCSSGEDLLCYLEHIREIRACGTDFLVSDLIETVEDALIVLADPANPSWADAFHFLSGHPDTSELVLETFQETLEQMGVKPSGTDPVTSEPRYRLEDVARALGVPESTLDLDTVGSSDPSSGS